jgi:hypothetical protein
MNLGLLQKFDMLELQIKVLAEDKKLMLGMISRVSFPFFSVHMANPINISNR